jgi:hypothetical protein
VKLPQEGRSFWTAMPIGEPPNDDGANSLSSISDSKSDPSSIATAVQYLKTAKYPDVLRWSNLNLKYNRLSPPAYLSSFLDGHVAEWHLFKELLSVKRGKNYANALPTILLFYMSRSGAGRPVRFSLLLYRWP